MTPLLRALLGVAEPGLVPTAQLTPNHGQLSQEFGRRILRITTGRCRTKGELLDTFANDLALPDWFGHNLDAAHEALHDQLATKTDLLLVVEAPAVTADGDGADALAFVDLVNSVLVERQTSGLLVGPAAEHFVTQLGG